MELPATNSSELAGQGGSVTGRWPKAMLMSAVTAPWSIYDIVTATEIPRRAAASLNATDRGARLGCQHYINSRFPFRSERTVPKSIGQK
jgi:hypothetical protein